MILLTERFKEAVQGRGLRRIFYPEVLGLVDRLGVSIVTRFMAGKTLYRP
jgi:hypothetical protein